MTMLTMKCKSVGNPDHGQYQPISDPVLVTGQTFSEIRSKAQKYIADNALGGGNWPNCQVMRGGKPVALMSYNGRFWTPEKNWEERKEIPVEKGE